MIDKKYISILKRYFQEAVILGLVVSVVTLFKMYNDLNDYIRNDLMKNNMKLIEVVERNTQALIINKN